MLCLLLLLASSSALQTIYIDFGNVTFVSKTQLTLQGASFAGVELAR